MAVLTVEMFKKVFPQNKTPEAVHDVFKKYFAQYEINTTNRRAGFLAQCGHESNGFTVLKENLNYSAEGLVKIFKKYFPTLELAKKYARQPEKIANKVYANRMGNGPEASGDGWKFAGKGAIQLTGKENYSAFAKFKGMEIDEVVAYLQTLEGAIESALWFWKSHGLNAYCDKDDIVGMTKKINGGTIGLDDRIAKYEKIKQLLA
jgi:putative chitinase